MALYSTLPEPSYAYGSGTNDAALFASKVPSLPSLSSLSSMIPIPNLTGGAGGSASAGPATNNADSMFDSSGWNVNFGAGEITSSATKSDPASWAKYLPFVLIGAGLLAWKIYKKH